MSYSPHRRRAKIAQGRTATTWNAPWKEWPLWRYDGLPKHEATALFLMRTEALRLNAWLASIGGRRLSPDASAEQMVCHISSTESPRGMGEPGPTSSVRCSGGLRGRKQGALRPGAEAAVWWLVKVGTLQQFNTGREIEEEHRDEYAPLPGLEQWGSDSIPFTALTPSPKATIFSVGSCPNF